MYNFFHTRFFNSLKPKTYTPTPFVVSRLARFIKSETILPKGVGVNLKPNGGFTLIELLIVVAIIGILSSVIFVTVSNVRPRARDVSRLAVVNQIRTALALQDAESLGSGNINLLGCTASDVLVSLCTDTDPATVAPNVNRIATLTGIRDVAGKTTVCGAAGVTSDCTYGISNAAGSGRPTTSDYRICFWLEDPTNSIANGVTTAAGLFHEKSTTGGSIISGCP